FTSVLFGADVRRPMAGDPPPHHSLATTTSSRTGINARCSRVLEVRRRIQRTMKFLAGDIPPQLLPEIAWFLTAGKTRVALWACWALGIAVPEKDAVETLERALPGFDMSALN